MGKPLKGVVNDVVRIGHLVHREVALEHAPVGPEIFDAGIHERRQRLGQFLRPHGYVPLRPIEAVPGLAHAAQLHDDVGAFGQVGQASTPLGQHLVVAVGVGAHT